MTVYITQEAVTWQNGVPVPKHDHRPAMKFGEIQVLLPPGVSNSVDHTELTKVLQRELVRFDDDDFLLCSGDPALIALAAGVAFKSNRGRISLLKWDRNQGQYFSVTLDIGE